MPFALLASLGLSFLFGQQTDPPDLNDPTKRYIRTQTLLEPGINTVAAIVRMPLAPLKDFKRAPRKELGSFAFVSGGYAASPEFKEFEPLRLSVYGQHRETDNELDRLVAMTLMRLWWFNYNRLGLDHSKVYKEGIIDVYLCWGGSEPAGGEQAFETDADQSSRIANNIYLYQLDKYPGPLEILREVAHEYGHATLPPFGGFSKPETFANGMLGEKLYMLYLRNQMQKGSIASQDIVGTKYEELNAFVKTEVEPFARRGLLQLPSASNFQLKTEQGMDNFLAFALAMQAALPSELFAKAIRTVESKKGAGLIDSVLSVVKQTPRVVYGWPKAYGLSAAWLPAANGKVSQGKILRKQGDWALVEAINGRVVVDYRPAQKDFVPGDPTMGG